MNKKHLLNVGAISAAVLVPVATVVACAPKKETKESITLDTGANAASKVIGVKKFYNDFIKGEGTKFKEIELHIASGNVDETVTLSKEDVKKIIDAGESDLENVDKIAPENEAAAKAFLDVALGDVVYVLASNKTPAPSGYGVFKKLKNAGNKVKNKVAGKLGLIADEAAIKDAITNKVFGNEMPSWLSIKSTTQLSSFTGKTQDHDVVFTITKADGSTMDVTTKAKLNLDHNQDVVNKHESKGGKIKQAVTNAKATIKKFAAKLKTFMDVTLDKIQDWGSIIVGFTENIIDTLFEKAADLTPAGALFKIPVVGGKILGYIQDHLIHPVVEKLMNPIKAWVDKKIAAHKAKKAGTNNKTPAKKTP